ncbi:MAG TPA: hypothetical protein VFT64_05815 [Rickettsiales bacterium]|nr:hypothetical protein [Rickettsiales bacterium]
MRNVLKRVQMLAVALISLSVAGCIVEQNFPQQAAPAQLLYSTENAAQTHCPQDTVVWVNTKTGVYHYPGQRWYGSTAQGAFACKNEADHHGYRSSHNGQ